MRHETSSSDGTRPLVEPAGCDSKAGVFVDHRFEGMSVGVTPPLLDWSLVDKTVSVAHDDMRESQRHFAESHGYLIGNTAAACVTAARRLVRPRDRRHRVLTLAYDLGHWYVGPSC